MKLWGIFRFEFAYQIRRPWAWAFFAVLLVLSFLMARDASLADAMYEDFFANAPFAIAKTTVIGGLAWLLLAPAIAGEAAARDVATGMYPLLYTASLRETDYLGGRFLAALALNALLLLAVQLGIMLGVYSPGVDAAVIGPFRPAAYLTAYLYISLPNALAATAIQFLLALRSGRAMAGYVGSLFLVFMGFFVASLLLYKRGLGTLVDPIGIRFIVEDLAHAWTTIERNTRLLGLDGIVLRNRLAWIAAALATIAFTLLRFRFAHRAEVGWPGGAWWRRRRGSCNAHAPLPSGTGTGTGTGTGAGTADTASKRALLSRPASTFGAALGARQTLAIAWRSFRSIATSLPGLALLIGVPLLTVAVVLDQMKFAGVPLVPTTARVLREMTMSLSDELSRWTIIPLVIVFFAGELVWREREARMAEITDAMPGSEWAPFLGKLLGLSLVLALFMAMLVAAGMIAQLTQGYAHFELGLYLTVLFGLQLPEYLLFALLAFVVHVVVDQKYVAHLLAIIVYMFVAALASLLGLEHNLLVYGAAPAWTYTDMRGFGPTIMPWLWFKLYWAAWALLLAVAARLLWNRGREQGPGVRVRLARHRFAGATRWVTAAAAALIMSLGSFIFYNTNIVNRYLSASDIAERSAEYERRYRRFAGIPQPQLVGTNLNVEIYPRQRAADVRGSYRLVNRSGQRIDSVLVATAAGPVETRTIAFDRAATMVSQDDADGNRIYALQRGLEPGDTLRLEFDVRAHPRGFREGGAAASVQANGSYFTNSWLPAVGYQQGRELISAAERRAQGLEPRPVIASLYQADDGAPTTRGGGVVFDAVVGTDTNQTGVAPGALQRTWTEGNRRYFQYSTDAPIGSEWAFFSAHYVVTEARWKDVAIRIFHRPQHTAHLDRVMRGVRASLDYYSAQYGAYPYRFLSIVERPGAPGAGMHAEPGMLTYGEGFSEWIPAEGSLDFPYAVVAHEMGHQWTLEYAPVEGAPFMSEGLAWYSAMQVVKASRGVEELRQLLVTMRRPFPYPAIRRGEPLLRALDPYLAYRRGPFAMYALSEYAGIDRVNGALRRLIARQDSSGAHAATTLDLYRELQAATPDSLKPLLHDLFEVNTNWQLATTVVRADSTPAGAWQVTLDVRARKTVYDSAGMETEVPMDQWVEIGVFAEATQGGELSAPLYLQKHRIRSGQSTIRITVPRKPVLAGIDPHHLLDWEEGNDDDNIDAVKVETITVKTK